MSTCGRIQRERAHGKNKVLQNGGEPRGDKGVVGTLR